MTAEAGFKYFDERQKTLREKYNLPNGLQLVGDESPQPKQDRRETYDERVKKIERMESFGSIQHVISAPMKDKPLIEKIFKGTRARMWLSVRL